MGGTPAHPPLKPHQSPNSSLRHRSINHHHHHYTTNDDFPEGSLIEVQTDEEDFKGVFFVATVIQSPSNNSKKPNTKTNTTSNSTKLYVEYRDLLASEDGSDNLREYVDVSFVRPAPPDYTPTQGFQVNDFVDAFYKDGWWTGVVTRVLDGAHRFVVTFQNPPDELEFGLSELRVHQDWVNGTWLLSLNQNLAAPMFEVGRKVEVSLDGEYYRDAWIPATILEDLGHETLLVKYSTSTTNNKALPLNIAVDLHHVRPCPPLLKDKSFVLLEKVDAYVDFGWWSGVITKELEGSKYTVFFKHSKSEKEFHQSELRPHMEWKDGKWSGSSQLPLDGLLTPESPSRNTVVPAKSSNDKEDVSDGQRGNTVAISVKSSNDKKDTSDGQSPSSFNLTKDLSDQLSPATRKPSRVNSSQSKRKKHLSDSQSDHSQTQKNHKEGINMISGPASPISVDNMTSPAAQIAIEDQPSLGKRTRRKQREVGSIKNDDEKVYLTSKPIKKDSMQTLQVEGPQPDVGGKELDVARSSAAVEVQDEDLRKENVVIGLPCIEMRSTRIGMSSGKRGRRSNTKEILKLDFKLSETEDSPKRKRGRPRRIPAENLETSVGENAQNEVVVSDDLSRKDSDPHRTPEVTGLGTEASLSNQGKMRSNESEKNVANPQSDPNNKRRSTRDRTVSKLQYEKVAKGSIELQGQYSSKRGRRRNVTENSAPQVEEVAPKASCSEFDDEPLSKWIEEMHSPSVTDGSKKIAVNNPELHMENKQNLGDVLLLEESNEQRQETGEKTTALVAKVSADPSNQRRLPFVKNTILWETIESMDVFKRIPQRPHFQPLEHHKESLREGLAIGHMVTFTSVVERVSRLQFNDDESVTNDILDTLADLERHGFDVSVVRDRVAELLTVKDKQGKLEDVVKEVNCQMVLHNSKKNRLEEEIRVTKEQIMKLQEKLSVAESAKGEEDGVIASLQARLVETEESIKNVESEFEGIAGSTMK